jgi:hypothetical protein
MGALSGNSNYLRFGVTGEPPNRMGDIFEQAIEARRFQPLNARSEENESAGWVAIEDPYDDDTPITRDRFAFGDLIALAYREDKFSVPRPLIKQLLKKKLAQLEEKGEKLNRQKRKAAEQAAVAELKKRSLPRPRVMDVVWDLTRSQVRIFGRGAMATERAVACFERTFAVRLGSPHWASRAFELDLSLRARAVLEGLNAGTIFDDALGLPRPRVDDGEGE